jgi:fermentation-respiration switch protein FrsA (DUF1100 family)
MAVLPAVKRFIPLAIAVAVLLVAVPVTAVSIVQSSIIYQPHIERVAPNFPETEAVRITTADGERLVAWYHAPEPNQPVFLFFDGNGGRPQIWGGRWRRIDATGAGFLAVYYRGYSGSTGAPSEEGLHLDARAGYDWLIARGYTPDDIVIHGFSLGTGVAVKLASERPARALILEAPFTGVDDVAAGFLTPPVASLIQDSFRSREWIDDVRMPVLIVHGDADTVIPFEHGQRLYTLANSPKHFVRMPGSDHATLVRDGIYGHIVAFLAQHPPSPDT